MVAEEDLFKNLNEEQKSKYKLLAEDLLDNVLFDEILVEMRRVASVKMFNKSQVIDDIIFSKAMLYTVDILKKKVELLKLGDSNESRKIGN